MSTLTSHRPTDAARIEERSGPGAHPIGTGDLVIDPAARQGHAVVGILRRTDPQAWLFAERARYLRTGSCDAYAEQLLRSAGFLKG